MKGKNHILISLGDGTGYVQRRSPIYGTDPPMTQDELVIIRQYNAVEKLKELLIKLGDELGGQYRHEVNNLLEELEK